MQCPSNVVPELNPLKSRHQTMFAGWNGQIDSETQVVAGSIEAGAIERRENKRAVPYALLNLLTGQYRQWFSLQTQLTR